MLGRGADCDIQVDRDSVSRRHARVFRARRGVVGRGSAVDQRQLRQRRAGHASPSLRDGDFLKIGAAIFKFLSARDIEASYHEEIYRMTIVDGLTGAHNKRYFLEFLEREIARCARYAGRCRC